VTKKSKSLVLCIDRDNDIGRKTDVEGPVVGWDRNLEVAEKLALEDPEDTDVNALYGALKLAKTMGLDVVTLTGDVPVGEVSDRKIADQLDKIIEEFNPRSVVVVTDGMDDEQLLPIIQSRIKIDAVRTIVVRQSKELEKAYFKFTNFLREISADPNLARLIFGVPGIALVLLALGGVQALSLILGVTGVYLVLRGMGWEESFFDSVLNFVKTLSIERIETVIYLIAVIALIISGGYMISDWRRYPIDISLDNMDATLNSISVFILNSDSITLFTISILVVIIGRILDLYASQRYVSTRRYLVLLGFIVLIRVILDSGANFIVNEEYGLGNFIFWGTVTICAFGVWTRLTEYLFMTEVGAIRRIVNELTDRDVYTSDGRHLGRVTNVFLDGMELSGIKVGKLKIGSEDVVSTDNVIIVNYSVK
jgi:putative membrane protein